MIKKSDLIGQKYGHLTITGIDYERINNSSWSGLYIFADCDCGVSGKSYCYYKLKKGETKSCGHLIKKHDAPNKKNIIVHTKDYGIIYTKDNHPFLFDLEDEHFLINKWWYEDDYGYLTHCEATNRKNKYIRFHRLVLNAKKGEFVDHISRKKNDNRKINLRICTHQENDVNKDIMPMNESGYIGVSWDKTRQKWSASLTKNKKSVYLGRYNNKEDAIHARLTGEKKYFGDFAPQRHLFELWGVD